MREKGLADCVLVESVETTHISESVCEGSMSAFLSPRLCHWGPGRSGNCTEGPRVLVHHSSSGPQASPCSGTPSYSDLCTKEKAVK